MVTYMGQPRKHCQNLQVAEGTNPYYDMGTSYQSQYAVDRAPNNRPGPSNHYLFIGEDAYSGGHRAVTPWSASSVGVRIPPSSPIWDVL